MHKRNAFTIVELLIVIIVIAILAFLAITSYTGITNKARVASLQSDLSANAKKLKLYNTQFGSYPTSLDSNSCPSAPTATTDSTYCLKYTGSNTLSTYTGTISTFTLNIANGTLLWKVTESSSPVSATAFTLTLNANTGGTVSGAGMYETGSTTTITATPNSGYTFSSWTGDTGCSGTASHTITITANTTCTASFALLPTLSLIAGTGGTVSGAGSYASGTTVTITATPNSGYLFGSWTGDTGCSGTASHTITITGNATCTAKFIVSSGTVVNLDAGNPSSYPGSGSTWYNLASSSYNATLNGGQTTYSSSNGGIINISNASDTSQTNYVELANPGTHPMNSANLTIDFVFKYNSYGIYWERVFDFGRGGLNTGSAQNAIILSRVSTGTNVAFRTHGSYVASYDLSASWNMNTWEHWTITWSSGGTISFYKNGQLVNTLVYMSPIGPSTYFAGSGMAPTSQDRYLLGRSNWADGGMNGSYGIFRIYNRVLSASEITQNFEATRSRYGL